MAMIDWDKVTELRDDVGAEDFGEVVELFLTEVDGKIDVLGASGGCVEHDLHFLKGAALNLGFAEFSGLCSTGEKAAANGQADAVDLQEIKQAYSAAKTVFLDELETRLSG